MSKLQRLEAYASAPLRCTSPQVKVLHCLTVRRQEARRQGVAARRGLKQRNARYPVRNASEHDWARQAGEPASKWRSQVRAEERNGRHSQSTEKGGRPEFVGWLVAEWESK